MRDNYINDVVIIELRVIPAHGDRVIQAERSNRHYRLLYLG